MRDFNDEQSEVQLLKDQVIILKELVRDLAPYDENKYNPINQRVRDVMKDMNPEGMKSLYFELGLKTRQMKSLQQALANQQKRTWAAEKAFEKFQSDILNGSAAINSRKIWIDSEEDKG